MRRGVRVVTFVAVLPKHSSGQDFDHGPTI